MGRARLFFGNCWKDGIVEAYLNDVKIEDKIKKGEIYVDFDFHDQDVIKLTGDGTAIIQFVDLKFLWCYPNENVVCNTNPHANDLKGSKLESVPGWTFTEVNMGPWDEKWDKKAMDLGCPKESWYSIISKYICSKVSLFKGRCLLWCRNSFFGTIISKGAHRG